MDGLKVGFSGSREGMTDHQRRAFIEWMRENQDLVIEFHHGMCIGGDAEAHQVIMDINETHPSPIAIHGHPAFPVGHSARADVTVDVEHDLMEPMVRNRVIVETVGVTFFAPKFPETQRSGTWATFRYARNEKKPVVMLAPMENPNE